VRLAEQPLDLFTLIEEVANGVHEAEDRDVRLEVQGHAAGAPFVGDAERLGTAFHSIFRAILREQPARCTVVVDRRLDTLEGATSAVIVVAESKAVQTVYGSAAGPFNDHRGGLGLALPIARRVIESHGGHLSAPAAADGADDRSTGRSAVVITLPIRS
jgi:nitrogen fixation/metabolism regulation signal transduction histidine kinase